MWMLIPVAILTKNQNANKWLSEPKIFWSAIKEQKTLKIPWEFKRGWGLAGFQVLFAFHATVCVCGGGEGWEGWEESEGGLKKVPRQHSPPYWQRCSIQPAAARGGDWRDRPEQLRSGTRRQQEAFQCEEAEFHSYTATHTSCWSAMYTWVFLKTFCLMIKIRLGSIIRFKIIVT